MSERFRVMADRICLEKSRRSCGIDRGNSGGGEQRQFKKSDMIAEWVADHRKARDR